MVNIILFLNLICFFYDRFIIIFYQFSTLIYINSLYKTIIPPNIYPTIRAEIALHCRFLCALVPVVAKSTNKSAHFTHHDLKTFVPGNCICCVVRATRCAILAKFNCVKCKGFAVLLIFLFIWFDA